MALRSALKLTAFAGLLSGIVCVRAATAVDTMAQPATRPASDRERLRKTAPWNQYTLGTLAALVEQYRESLPAADRVYETVVPKTLVTAVYLAKKREMPVTRREFLAKWEGATNHRFPATQLFREEVLLEEGGKNYWIPIQSNLIASLDAEVKPGTQAEWFVACLGREGKDIVLLINEFDPM
jgi:hypothetical protein